MDPVHIAYILTACGVLIFFFLGFFSKNIWNAFSGKKTDSKPSFDENQLLRKELEVAVTKARELERNLTKEKREAETNRNSLIETEVKLTWLFEQAVQMKEQVNLHMESLSDTRKKLDTLEDDLQLEKKLHGETKANLERQDKAAFSLLSKLRNLRTALKEQEERTLWAMSELEGMRGDLTQKRKTMFKEQAHQKELVLAKTLREFIDRSWPHSWDSLSIEENEKREITIVSPPELDTKKLAKFSPTKEDEKDRPSRPSSRPSKLPGEKEFKQLEKRVKSVETRPPTASIDESFATIPRLRTLEETSDQIGEHVLSIGRLKDISFTVLADSHGLPVAAVGEGEFQDNIGAFSALLGQLSIHASAFLPMDEVLTCHLHDDTDLIYSCWLVGTEEDRFMLSTISRGQGPSEKTIKKAISKLDKTLISEATSKD